MKIYKELPNQKTLHHLFEYRDGELYWKIKTSNRASNISVGEKAGWVESNKGKRLTLYGETYEISRLIFVMFHGYDPKLIIYLDKNRGNTRVENLYDGNRSILRAYGHKLRSNTSGYKGVSWDDSMKKWRARITYNGRSRSLGRFDSKENAAQVYRKAARELHGEFANFG